MSTDETDYEELLLQAADTARKLIQKKDGERTFLMERVKRIAREIEQLEKIVQAVPVTFEEEVGLVPANDADLSAILDALLTERPYRFSELKEEIDKRSTRGFGTSTIYSYLTAGKDAGRYENSNRVWRISASWLFSGRPPAEVIAVSEKDEEL